MNTFHIDMSENCLIRYQCPFYTLKKCCFSCERYYTSDDLKLHASTDISGEMALDLARSLIACKLEIDPTSFHDNKMSVRTKRLKPRIPGPALEADGTPMQGGGYSALDEDGTLIKGGSSSRKRMKVSTKE
jgi:hypothetical protein